jgi:hypothetical protein
MAPQSSPPSSPLHSDHHTLLSCCTCTPHTTGLTAPGAWSSLVLVMAHQSSPPSSSPPSPQPTCPPSTPTRSVPRLPSWPPAALRPWALAMCTACTTAASGGVL